MFRIVTPAQRLAAVLCAAIALTANGCGDNTPATSAPKTYAPLPTESPGAGGSGGKTKKKADRGADTVGRE